MHVLMFCYADLQASVVHVLSLFFKYQGKWMTVTSPELNLIAILKSVISNALALSRY